MIAKPEEPDEVHAAGGEERARADRAIARQAIEHAADQEQRHQHVRRDRDGDHRRQRRRVRDGAEVLHHRGEAENGGHEAHADARGLRQKLVPPVEVDAVGRRLRRQARAKVIADQLPAASSPAAAPPAASRSHRPMTSHGARLTRIKPVDERSPDWPDGLMA